MAPAPVRNRSRRLRRNCKYGKTSTRDELLLKLWRSQGGGGDKYLSCDRAWSSTRRRRISRSHLKHSTSR